MSRNGQKQAGRRNGPKPPALVADLEHRAWRNWVLIIGIVVLTTGGLGVSIVSLLSARGDSPWPWSKTEMGLLGGLALVIVIVAGSLTQQQRRLMNLHRELERSREKTSRQLEKHYERLMAVYNVSHTLASETNLHTVFVRLVEICFNTFPCDQVSLMLMDPSSQELKLESAVGDLDPGLALGARQAVGAGVAGWVAEHREPLLLGPQIDPGKFRGFKPKTMPPSAAMVVPILLRDELVGVLSISSRSPWISYDREDLQALLVFAENAGTCIRHTEQVEWMRQTNQRLEAALRASEARAGRAAA